MLKIYLPISFPDDSFPNDFPTTYFTRLPRWQWTRGLSSETHLLGKTGSVSDTGQSWVNFRGMNVFLVSKPKSSNVILEKNRLLSGSGPFSFPPLRSCLHRLGFVFTVIIFVQSALTPTPYYVVNTLQRHTQL